MDEKSPNETVSGLAERLRRALARKNRAAIVVASGVSDRTITKILQGHVPRFGTLAALAESAGVSPSWLADGLGPMAPPPATQPAEPPEPIDIAKLPDSIDHARLGAAIRIAERVVRSPQTADEWRNRAAAVIETYNALTDQAADQLVSKRPLRDP